MPERPEPRVKPTHQRLRAWRAGRLIGDARRAHLYFPNTHPGWAVQP